MLIKTFTQEIGQMETKTAKESTSSTQQARSTLEPTLREKWSVVSGSSAMEPLSKVTLTTISPRVRVNGTSRTETLFRVLIDRPVVRQPSSRQDCDVLDNG